ncbi:WXG100 family type VII secretion target [Agromyces sp. LHK192]|uniref:WXG100 family type VII secretion target n=1 Tax=Agromyces sp. LHK192 TaxID=2498704 RepID=UPI000FD6F459|nr:WXG100 family type VII secretion target [Agromyces sp. LHK192]
MVYFKVRADSLSDVAGRIGTVIATFDANLAGVSSTVTSMAQTTWRGLDADKFAEEWANFETQAALVRQALSTLQMKLIAADGSYTRTETGVRTSFNGAAPTVAAVRRSSDPLGKRVASGEEKAEDMAEFFGRDYAGDDEVEQFGGGMLGPRKSSGQATGGGSGDTDGDGDDDGIGEGVFRLDAVGESLGLPEAFEFEPHDGSASGGIATASFAEGGRDA